MKLTNNCINKEYRFLQNSSLNNSKNNYKGNYNYNQKFDETLNNLNTK